MENSRKLFSEKGSKDKKVGLHKFVNLVVNDQFEQALQMILRSTKEQVSAFPDGHIIDLFDYLFLHDKKDMVEKVLKQCASHESAPFFINIVATAGHSTSACQKIYAQRRDAAPKKVKPRRNTLGSCEGLSDKKPKPFNLAKYKITKRKSGLPVGKLVEDFKKSQNADKDNNNNNNNGNADQNPPTSGF